MACIEHAQVSINSIESNVYRCTHQSVNEDEPLKLLNCSGIPPCACARAATFPEGLAMQNVWVLSLECVNHLLLDKRISPYLNKTMVYPSIQYSTTTIQCTVFTYAQIVDRIPRWKPQTHNVPELRLTFQHKSHCFPSNLGRCCNLVCARIIILFICENEWILSTDKSPN